MVRNAGLRVGLALACLLAAGAAAAQRVEGDVARAQGAYQAEVPVRSQGAAERNTAFARALSQVLGKISGDRNAAARPGVGEVMRRRRLAVHRSAKRGQRGVDEPIHRSALSSSGS